ncbi:hypothetical protein [uncultured Bacteroides sp.]|uniref:hypothetical protein n=1 Tax=uncultured Bacteroides sp. TaxID=162156 RepID=UPI0026349216|nr:hypothetical protein [uncultured Bacteroides sp.]
MAKVSKCPYCNSTKVKRTTEGYIEESIGMAIGGGLSFLAGMAGINHINSKCVRDYIPTNYICSRCHKTFHVTSIEGEEYVWNDDAPVNIRKRQIKDSGIYSCLVTYVDMSSWWCRFNTKRVITSYGGLTSEQYEYLIANLPQKLSFESKELLDEFKESLSNYHGRCKII